MPRKILVVDDNLDTRELTHLRLTTEGFTVVVAADGRECLYMAGAETPDLIITAISMPERDGIDMIRQIREQPDNNNVPILVLTAFGSEVVDQSIAVGATLALKKPVHLDVLLAEVRELLDLGKHGN